MLVPGEGKPRTFQWVDQRTLYGGLRATFTNRIPVAYAGPVGRIAGVSDLDYATPWL